MSRGGQCEDQGEILPVLDDFCDPSSLVDLSSLIADYQYLSSVGESAALTDVVDAPHVASLVRGNVNATRPSERYRTD